MHTTRAALRCISGPSLFLLMFFGASAQAQSLEWTVRLANGESLQRVALTRLTPDSLIVTDQSEYAEWILVDSVAQLQRERRGAILPSVLIGSVGGGVLGIALKPVAKNQGEADAYSAVFGVVVGGVAGFLVGSLIQSDDVYDFRTLDHPARISLLKGLLPPTK
jgi:hypothetical protein